MLGRRLVEVLQQRIENAEIIESIVDLTEKDKVEGYIRSLPELDFVFHLAAIVPIEEVNKNPFVAFSVNVGGTLNLLASLKPQSQIFIFASTSHVYAPQNTPIKEDDTLSPISIYGETKLYC